MKILFAAGGTAGHVNPALAIAHGLKEQYPQAEIHFAGRRDGMEYRLVQQAGFPFHPIQVHGLQRSFAPKDLARNLKAAAALLVSPFATRRILNRVKPDIVIGTGGYVSVPIVYFAAKRGLKTAIHEQNAYPGLANRFLAKRVDKVFVASEAGKARLTESKAISVSGNPVSPTLFEQDRTANRRALEAGERPVIISYGGSLGAMNVNRAVAELAQWHIENRDFLHIHATGSIEAKDFAAQAAEMGIDNSPHFIIREYIDNMPELLSAADLVISRAGALTLAELAATGRASVLIPSPNVAENHQYHNAAEFEAAGAAKLIEEKNLTGDVIIQTVDALTKDGETLHRMGENAKTLARQDALATILEGLRPLLPKV